MSSKTADTSQPIHELLAERWSPRAFDADRAVSQEDLIALFEAARWAPSCFNEQPWRFIVCNRSDDQSCWDTALSCLAPKNRLWAKNAPVLALVASTDEFAHNGNTNRWAQYDAGQAAACMTVQATALGLHVHQMGGFDADKAASSFNLPDDSTAIAMMAIGYEGSIEDLDADFVEAEQAPRERSILSGLAFKGSWGKSLLG